MNRERILTILYEMASIIGGETESVPLMRKTLQRLLYHTAMPCGVFLTLRETAPQHSARSQSVRVEIAMAIGNAGLSGRIGECLELPATFLYGKPGFVEESGPHAACFGESGSYQKALRLPVEDAGVFFLFSNKPDRESIPFAEIFVPVMGHFAKSYALCRRNEETTRRLQEEIAQHKRTEEALRKRKGYLRLVLDNVVDGIITVSQAGIIESFNPAAERIFGYGRKEIVGQSLTLLMPQRYRVNHDHSMRAFLERGERNVIGISRDIFGLRKDGTEFPISIAVGRVPSEQGALFTGIVRDITEQKQAERVLRESEQNLKEAQRIAHLGNWCQKRDSGNLQWSDEFYRICGLEPGAFQPSREGFFRLVHPEDRARVQHSLQAAFDDGLESSIDYRIVRPNGVVRWVHEERKLCERDGHGARLTGTLQDVTELKRTEADLLRAKEEAEQASRAKSEFLSNMSHELRTPLNAILGFAQLLERSRRYPLNEKQKERVERISSAGQHLLDLINEVLDLAKIESGKMRFSIEDVQAGRLVEESVSLASTMASNRGSGIDLDGLSASCERAVVRADYLRAKQALLNLLSNAVKYNREKGVVTLACAANDDGYLHIEVKDEGPGIPEDQHDELFKPFSRLGAEGSEVEGTGIGLMLTKRIVESMGGRIGFESSSGLGSTFWIDLPLSETTTERGPVRGAAVGADEKETTRTYQVLYVEDNPANLHLMEDIIEEVPNIELIAAHTAELGLELAKGRRPDLVILDINLPGMDGLEAMSCLKRDPVTSEIPVIALSANAMPGAVQEALDRGFLEYLTKPVDVERLMRLLSETLDLEPNNRESAA